jgi:hypothetical protein
MHIFITFLPLEHVGGQQCVIVMYAQTVRCECLEDATEQSLS